MADQPPVEATRPVLAVEEQLDVLTASGEKTGLAKSRKAVHRDGDWHRVVHVWLYNSRFELVLQKRSESRESFPGLWDISAAGHISAGDDSATSASKELHEELGIAADAARLQLLFHTTNDWTLDGGRFVNREHVDVYLMAAPELDDPAALAGLKLEAGAVDAVCLMPQRQLRRHLEQKDPSFVPVDNPDYWKLFDHLDALQAVAAERAAAGTTGAATAASE